ncbi:24616_t:CDS:1, partial [Racocetra persica]
MAYSRRLWAYSRRLWAYSRILDIFFPGKYLDRKEYTNPFLNLIDKLETVENNDAFYYNPSMEAIMNFVWYMSKSHW